MPVLTPDQIKQFQAVFKKIDTKKDNLIDPNELQVFMKTKKIDTKFIPTLFELFDIDGDGMFSFEEFIHYFELCIMNVKDPHLLYQYIFDFVDVDQDGLINLLEMNEFCRIAGIPISKVDAKRQFLKIDTDNDQKINFEDLLKFFNLW